MAKFVSSTATISSARENYSPQMIQRIGRELQELVQRPPEGITYVPNDEDNISEIYADIEGPIGTPFHNGSFRMKLVLGKDFPHCPPRGYFLTKIFHPNISSTGDICVNTLKKDWDADVSLSHVLQVIRCLLIIPFPESSLNDEAGRLFMESYEEFARRATIMTSVHAIPRKKAASLGELTTSESEASTISESETKLAVKGNSVSSAVKDKIRDKQKENRKKGLKRL